MQISKKLVIITLGILIIASTSSAVVLDSYLRGLLKEHVKSELGHVAALALVAFRELGDKTDVATVDGLVDRLGASSGARITIIDEQGWVIGDSALSPSQIRVLDNHASRPEVRLAINTGSGVAERFSETLNTIMMYFATTEASNNDRKKVHDAGAKRGQIIARSAMSSSDVNAALMRMRWGWFLIMAASWATVIILGLFASRSLAKVVANERATLEDRVDVRTRELALLQNMSNLLSACTTVEEVGKLLTQVLPKILSEFKGAITVLRSPRSKFILLMNWGEDWPGVNQFSSDDCWALRKGHQHRSSEQAAIIVCDHYDDAISGDTLCIPLMAQGEAFGVLHLVGDHTLFDDNNIKLAGSAAEQIGLALANLRLRNNLREQAIRDPLTGIYNRRYMMETLEQEFSRAKRKNSTIGFLMIDLDHFKNFNDVYGHDAGDRVLKRVARELRKHSRTEDTVCRFGGEEFCLVCPDISLENAQFLAEKFRRRISNLDVSHNNQAIDGITLSVGVSLFPHHAHNAEMLIKSADEALYRAKSEGRNRVAVSLVNKAGVKSQFLLI